MVEGSERRCFRFESESVHKVEFEEKSGKGGSPTEPIRKQDRKGLLKGNRKGYPAETNPHEECTFPPKS